MNVTYIANAGFLIEINGRKILIDALFSNGYGYPAPSTDTQNKMRNGAAHFDNISLALTSHSHSDHCGPSLLVDHLKNNTMTKSIVSLETWNTVRQAQNTSTINTRLFEITPDLYKSIDTTLNGIKIKVNRLRHSGSNNNEQNIGFLIKIDGFTIFHAGDSDGTLDEHNTGKTGIEEYSSMQLENENIDVAFLNRGFFWEPTAPGIEIIKQSIKPKNIVLCHFSENNSQGEWQTVNNVIEGVKNSIPPITILRQLMEKKTFVE
jgi:L-ascorbate metabolism protein UlaG (beta-lactamase superfamily)